MNLAGCPDTDTYKRETRMKAPRTLWFFILDERDIYKKYQKLVRAYFLFVQAADRASIINTLNGFAHKVCNG